MRFATPTTTSRTQRTRTSSLVRDTPGTGASEGQAHHRTRTGRPGATNVPSSSDQAVVLSSASATSTCVASCELRRTSGQPTTIRTSQPAITYNATLVSASHAIVAVTNTKKASTIQLVYGAHGIR